jgi:hypothetical protein
MITMIKPAPRDLSSLAAGGAITVIIILSVPELAGSGWPDLAGRGGRRWLSALER